MVGKHRIQQEVSVKFWGREPALYLALFAALVQMGSQFIWHLSDDQQGVLNAVAAALVGLIVAFMAHSDGESAAIMGFVQALLALGVAFGLGLDATAQSIIMSFVSAAVAMFIRGTVTAKLDADGLRR